MEAAIADEFRQLLEQRKSEQTYHSFLEQHTEFIPREFVQNHGIHLSLVLRKLSLGADLTTDFFYLSKSSDDWNCVLVELEKPYSRFFQERSNRFHADFRQALEQINSWRAWFLVPGNKQHFVDTSIGFLRKPPLHENPCHFKYVLVHGRRGEYSDNDTRKRMVLGEEREDFKIVTYDSLLEYPHETEPLYVGARTTDGLSLLSDQFITDSPFIYLAASQLEVGAALFAEASKPSNWILRNFGGTYYMQDALPRLRVRQ